MAGRPLLQPPLLHDARRFLERGIFARHVAAEELEVAADVRAFEEFGRRPREGGEPGRVREGLVELGGRGAEFFGGGHGRGVDEGGLGAGLRCGCCCFGGGGG